MGLLLAVALKYICKSNWQTNEQSSLADNIDGHGDPGYHRFPGILAKG